MFNGAILVVDQGEIIYKKGFRFANMEWNIPDTMDTKFQIALMPKAFTSMLIMQLVAENKLELNQPISTYLKEYPKEEGDQITIHHLLTHSSGQGQDRTNKEKHNRPEAMVHQFSSVPTEFTQGVRFKYSNSGYTILGYIIETVTEKTYEDVLQERIFDSLQMHN